MKLVNKALLSLMVLAGVSAGEAQGADNPQLSSWYTTNSAKYARVYTTTTARNNGTTSTTWTDQDLPTYSDIQEISYSASWVYVKYSGLASHVMGPWLNPQGGQFQFWPVNQAAIRRFPRTPAEQAGTKDSTSGGYSGLFVNGVAIFNSLDGQAWDGSQIQGQAPHTQSTYYWHRNAPVAEAFNFDEALGHQPPSGIYHTHQNPLGLRYQLGDHVDYNSSSKAYSESAAAVTKHSPIIGWSHDGYPIYGPYGYGTALNSGSAVRRMVSGYVKRDGSNGTDMVDSNRSVIPAWYARYRQAHFGGGYSTAAGVSRPAVNTTYPLGTFAQDWAYLGDLSKTQGVDFDLDEYNGRYCVTPEYPSGTYAYFTTIDASGDATYPYVFAFEFYGNASGGSVSSISETVTSHYVGGPNKALEITQVNAENASDTVTVTWSAVEGGTYQVETSANGSSWTVKSSGLVADSVSEQSSYTTTDSSGFTRLTRTALATYDPVVTGSAAGSQTDSEAFLFATKVWYVDASRAGQATQDGAAWSTAFAYLQDALYEAMPGDEVWVKAGVYYPDEAVNPATEVTDNDRESSFHLQTDVAVYGGFAGTETERSQRNPTANRTVLSGDLEKNDVTVNGVVVASPETNISGNNAYHVVSSYESFASAILDGFTITAGQANVGDELGVGGGVFCIYGIMGLSNCVIQGNLAQRGAVAVTQTGEETLVISNCSFLANTATLGGAGIYGYDADMELISCRFQGNTSLGSDGGSAVTTYDGATVLANCLVTGNSSSQTAAIYAGSSGSFYGLSLLNCTIAGNYAETSNATGAGGVAAAEAVQFEVYNSIIWGNVMGGSSSSVNQLDSQYYSLIEGLNPGNNGNLDGTGVANKPLFLSDITASATASTSGDFRLYGNSPGVNAGDNAAESEVLTDLAGNNRKLNSTVDMGAYEYNGPVAGAYSSSLQLSATASSGVSLLNLNSLFGGTYTYSATVVTAGVINGSVNNESGTFVASATGSVNDSTSVVITATDGTGNKTSITFTVTLVEESEPSSSLTQNVSSWLKQYSGRYARIYRTYADEQAGAAQTTWDNGTYSQTLPVYGGVQKIQHSDNYVYVKTTGLAAGHVMGPWYNDTGAGGSLQVFQNWPEAIYTTYRIPVNPVIPTSKTTYGAGAIGLMVDGTMIYSGSDTFSWNNNGDGTGNGSDTGPTVQGGGLGDGLWLHDAYLTEGNTFDRSNAHAAGNQLHYHASPMKLRHLLGDSVQATQQADGSYTYTENFNGKHSPIIGWMNDGLPLYGPYGYSDALNANSSVRRMVSGFIVRNGQNGSYNIAANGRTQLPAWAARYRNRSAALTINEQGPTAGTIAVPYFMEDYDYLGDLTNPGDGQPYEQGVDFDLNEYNVRFCVTPEFPQGTWAYFVSVGADGAPAFPYNVGMQFYGNPSTGGAVSSITETVTTDWTGGPDSEIKLAVSGASANTVTISWSAVEGGTYTLESKTDVSSASWPTAVTGLTPVKEVGQRQETVSGTQRYYRMYRTALAAYDSTGTTAGTGGGGGGGGGGGTGDAPTISQVSPNSGTAGAQVTVNFTLSGTMLPPAQAVPTSVTIGSTAGTSISYNGSVVTASFTLPAGTGAQNVTITFPAPPDGEALVISLTNGFTINAGGGGGGGVVTFNATFPTNPPLPPQGVIEAAAVGTAVATITSYNQATGAVTLQFNNSTLAPGNYRATMKFTPPAMTQQTLTSSNQYTKN